MAKVCHSAIAVKKDGFYYAIINSSENLYIATKQKMHLLRMQSFRQI